MAKTKKKLPNAKNNKQNILDTITPDDAFAILNMLAKEDTKIKEKIEQLATDYLSDVDIEAIASQVYMELDFIEVEELWDRSGATREGYVDPDEMAFDMFEESLEPFLEELKKYQNLSMPNQAMYYCMGILKGIYRFEKESKTEYKDWATDAPYEYFNMILNDWRKGCKRPEDLKRMEDFIKKDCPDWASLDPS